MNGSWVTWKIVINSLQKHRKFCKHGCELKCKHEGRVSDEGTGESRKKSLEKKKRFLFQVKPGTKSEEKKNSHN